MLTDNQDKPKPQSKTSKLIPWLNMALALILIALGIWYLSGKVSLADILDAILIADMRYIVLGILVMIITVLMKAWRWRLMFMASQEPPSFSPIFWALMLGQYVNLIVPFFRLGEVARIYGLNRQTNIKMAQSLGTLVVEKVLDAVMLALTLAMLLPFVILPEFIGDPGLILWTVPIAGLLVLYLLAYQTNLITRFFQAIAVKVPVKFGKRLLQWSISGLEGLSALRSKRLTLLLILWSVVIAFLSVSLPYIMFLAFDIPLGFIEAVVIHIVVTLATTPPSTPGKIGVFNGAVAFVLVGYGLENEAQIIGYSIIFHLVVIVPQILLGAIAAFRTDWSLHHVSEQGLAA